MVVIPEATPAVIAFGVERGRIFDRPACDQP